MHLFISATIVWCNSYSFKNIKNLYHGWITTSWYKYLRCLKKFIIIIINHSFVSTVDHSCPFPSRSGLMNPVAGHSSDIVGPLCERFAIASFMGSRSPLKQYFRPSSVHHPRHMSLFRRKFSGLICSHKGTPSIDHSIFHCVILSFSAVAMVKVKFSAPYVITGNTYWLKTILLNILTDHFWSRIDSQILL